MSFFAPGGPYMVPMLIIGLIGLAVLALIIFRSMGESSPTHVEKLLVLLRHIAVFVLVLGVLSQAHGLFQAMSAIEAAGDISPALLAGGLKVSLIAPIFGLVEFLVLYAGYAIVRLKV